MIREIQAKTMLSHRKEPDPWFGYKYNMNIYRGCQHQCIYCDSRSDCYQIEDFNDVLVKVNAIPLLHKELASKRVKGTIGFGAMSDPYTQIERKYQLTRQALEVIAEFRYPIHMLTKSDLVLRDLDLLKRINEVFAIVSFTLTTVDDDLAAILEPQAPLPSARLRAMQTLVENGIPCGVMLMPILPFIEDTPENITSIVEATHRHGGSYILPALGMSLRGRQREYYYEKLDEHFPGLSDKYRRMYSDSYHCPPPNYRTLENHLARLCKQHNIPLRVPRYTPPPQPEQLTLF